MKINNKTLFNITFLQLIIMLFVVTSCSVLISPEMLEPTNSLVQLYNIVPTPTNVNATVGNTDYITITFDEVSEAASYNIYKSTAADGIYGLLVSGIKTNSFQDTINISSLLSGNFYYYKVTALNKDFVESDLSNAAKGMCFTTTSSLVAPTVTYISNCESSSFIKIMWSSVKGAFGYTLERSLNPSDADSWEVLESPIGKNITTYIDKDNFTSGVSNYYYRLSSLNDNEQSLYSTVAIGSICDPSVVVPKNLVAAKGESNSEIAISFDSNYNQFEIYRSDKENGIYTVVGKTTSPFFADRLDGVEVKEKPYFYRVQAISNGKRSAMSEVAMGSLKIEAPVITFEGGIEKVYKVKIKVLDENGNEKLDDEDNPIMEEIEVTYNTVYIDMRKGQFYDEATYMPTCIDNIDGDISDKAYVSKGTVISDEIGEYSVEYKATDLAGNSSTAVRKFLVGRSPSLENAKVSLSASPVVYQDFTLLLNNVFPKQNEINDNVGETLTYSASFSKSATQTNDGANFTFSFNRANTTDSYSTKIIVSNKFGSDEINYSINVSPFNTPLSWNFEEGFGPYCADVAIDIAPDAGFKTANNLKENFAYGGAAYAEEQIIAVVNDYFSMCDTTKNTNFWGAGDKQGTSIRLRSSEAYTLEANRRYKLSMEIYRGEGATAAVVVSLGGQNVTAPTSAGWHTIELALTPSSTTSTTLEINKGGWHESITCKEVASNGDQIEVRVKNISLICMGDK